MASFASASGADRTRSVLSSGADGRHLANPRSLLSKIETAEASTPHSSRSILNNFPCIGKGRLNLGSRSRRQSGRYKQASTPADNSYSKLRKPYSCRPKQRVLIRWLLRAASSSHDLLSILRFLRAYGVNDDDGLLWVELVITH
jgi:hypothetical protein